MKKLQALRLFSRRKVFLKFLCIMKLTALILTIGCVHAFATGFSQEKINLNVKDASLKNVINSIQRNSDYRFIYNDDILPKDKKITASFTNANLVDVLNFAFQSTLLTYKFLENNLVVISSQPLATAI